MTTEQILFALLRSQICGAPVDAAITEQISPQVLEELYTLSHMHDLSHLVGHALSDLGVLGQGEISKKFQEAFLSSVSRYVRMTHELYSVCSVLEAAGIDHMPLKGALIRAWYPEPWMRTCTDMDILVRQEDVERATACICEKLNYEYNETATCDISLFSPTGVHLELHFNLIEDAVSEIQGAVLSRVWNVAKPVEGFRFQYEMPGSWFRFYHYAHMAKHMTSGGCGIRPLMDLWIMNRCMEYDKEEERQLLEEGRLVAFRNAMEALSEHWFSQEPTNAFGELLESYILGGGKHGTFKNRVAVRQIRRGGKFHYALHRIFKPYESLKKLYPVLEKHKWLMPFCQVHRWSRLITHRNLAQFSINELKINANIAQEESTVIKELLKKLEL